MNGWKMDAGMPKNECETGGRQRVSPSFFLLFSFDRAREKAFYLSRVPLSEREKEGRSYRYRSFLWISINNRAEHRARKLSHFSRFKARRISCATRPKSRA